jgi:Mrp family chromosome partitioning ATPase
MKIIPNNYQELEKIYNIINKNKSKCITFISSNENTGNTTLAISMAKRLSGKNQRVLFIDLNTCHTLQKECVDKKCINDKWSFTDISCQLNTFHYQDFFFLSIENLIDLKLVKENNVFEKAISMLLQEYDYILFDMSPLNKKNHSNFPLHLLLSETDLVLLNISFKKTTQENLDKSIKDLNSSGCKNFEIVVNQTFMPPLGDKIIEKLEKHLSKLPKLRNKLIKTTQNKKWLFRNT